MDEPMVTLNLAGSPAFVANFAAGEIRVTPEMREIGGAALREECMKRFGTSRSNDVAWDFAEVAFRAMHAIAPVELVSEGERIAVRERDEARREREAVRISRFQECEYLRLQLAAKDARIAELKSELANRPAKIPLGNRPHASDCAVHSAPALTPGPCDCGAMDKPHDPFREFPSDPRRMGWR